MSAVTDLPLHKLTFRQIHLDFHTSEAIEGIGADFDPHHWQETLKEARVDSITCFAKCHHGWSYHPTKVGKQHPHLAFDLLRAQFDSAKKIGVRVPVYLSAGFDNVASAEHPEWRETDKDGRFLGSDKVGFHTLCFNSPYLDYLCDQIREVVALFPYADGIFLDITSQRPCWCHACREVMRQHNLDPDSESDVKACAVLAMERYMKASTEACVSLRADMPVFHNAGHVTRGDRDTLKYYSHLELESLPTGGWGYDHFPLSARYVINLNHDYLGMTGKFHTTWGEFGGYKHPNALRYECAAMLAFGAKCSIGDQLHPSGKMDQSTYGLIGASYKEVQAKEQWCQNVRSVADIGMLSSSAVNEDSGKEDTSPDSGAVRALLEGHFLFDVLDMEMDFNRYKLMILPDDIRISTQLGEKLSAYLAQGGKLLCTGTSGLGEGEKGFAFDFGTEWFGQSEFQPDYVMPRDDLRAPYVSNPLVMYLPSQRIKVTDGLTLGDVYDPYFNRTAEHFCSHQHAPPRPEASGYDCGVRKGNLLYLAHPVFRTYGAFGATACREYICRVIRHALEEPTLLVDLPTTARATLMHQPEHDRFVLHLLNANPISRGGLPPHNVSLGVIEDCQPLHDVQITLRLDGITSVTLEPQGRNLDFTVKGNTLHMTLDRLELHQMIVLHRD